MAIAVVILAVALSLMLYVNKLLLSALIHARRSARTALPLIVDSAEKDSARPALKKFLKSEEDYTKTVNRVPRVWGL